MEQLISLYPSGGKSGIFLSTVFWALVFTFLYSTSTVLTQEEGEKPQLRLGVLLPEYRPGMRPWPYFRQMVQPGIDIALQKVTDTILPGHNVTYLSLDTRCSNQMSMVLSVHMKYQYECDVFFGPACEYAVAPTARFCDYWEVPLITAGALAQGFSKQYFNSITRMQGSYDKFANFLVEFFELQNWNTTILLLDQSISGEIKDCFFCMGGVSWTFYEVGIPHEVEEFDEKSLTGEDIRKTLEQVRLTARNFPRVEDIYFSNVHRLPTKGKSTKPDPIIAKFLCMKDRNAVLNFRTANNKSLPCAPHLPASMQAERKRLIPIRNKKIAEGHSAKIMVKGVEVKLLVDNAVYGGQ